MNERIICITYVSNARLIFQKQRSVHHLNIRNFDSCDVICGTEVLYNIIRDSALIYIFKMKHCLSRAKGYKFLMLNSAEHEIQITHKSCK